LINEEVALMDQHVAVEAKHFIGAGKKAWLIVGRIPGQDDDTAYLVLADDEGIAQATFEAQLFEDGDVTDEARADLEALYGCDVFVTSSQLLN
jgi:hypothetical protein